MRPNGAISEALRGTFKLLIDGRLADALDGAELTTTNPATGAILAAVPNAGQPDIDNAVAAAKRGWPSWRALTFAQRRKLVLRLGEILRQHAELFAMLDTVDTGNLYAAMRRDAGEAADMIEYYAAIGFELKGYTTQLDRNLHYTRHEPFGVVARMLPFNHPIASLGTSLAAPLLTGNCLIIKPSPHTPLSALAFGRLVADILPPGVLNILTGDNDRLAVPLIKHPGVDRLSLTGSVEAGKATMRLAADRLVPLTLELGGKNPLVVFPDFDPAAAADLAVAAMNFAWQAHSCASTSRVLVHTSIERPFLDHLVERIGKIKVGDPFDPTVQMGAISNKLIFERCQRYIAQGKSDGARLLVGGTRPADAHKDGMFLKPALFAGAQPHMSIARDEIFGPIITVLSWNDYEKMIELANGLPYGLTAVIATNDLNTAHCAAADLEAGYIEVNGSVSFSLGSPYGGIKQSGVGREGCMEEMLSYTRTKSVNVRLR
jgi:acyl-CoA reductase-like NAD-dependent aldehyde dehydrogenase